MMITKKLIRSLNKNNKNDRVNAANLREIIEETRKQGKRLKLSIEK